MIVLIKGPASGGSTDRADGLKVKNRLKGKGGGILTKGFATRPAMEFILMEYNGA